MISLTSLQVNTLDIDHNNIEWVFEPTSEDLSDYAISIYRGESPNPDEQVLIASGINPAVYSKYKDTGVDGIYHPQRTWFYVIHVQHQSILANSLVSDPAYIKSYTTDRPTLEIIRRKKLALNRFVKTGVYILRRKTYGTRCSLCWDSTLSRRTIDDDLECYGTGITGGYFKGEKVDGSITASPKYNQITMFGEWMPSDCMLNLVGVPPVKVNDIIVDETTKRWAIKSVRTIEKGNIVIEQICQLTLISPADLLYQFPIA